MVDVERTGSPKRLRVDLWTNRVINCLGSFSLSRIHDPVVVYSDVNGVHIGVVERSYARGCSRVAVISTEMRSPPRGSFKRAYRQGVRSITYNLLYNHHGEDCTLRHLVIAFHIRGDNSRRELRAEYSSRHANKNHQSSSIDDVIVDSVTSKIYHIEKRPAEGGRNVLVKTEESRDVFGKEWNCRSGVYEVCIKSTSHRL